MSSTLHGWRRRVSVAALGAAALAVGVITAPGATAQDFPAPDEIVSSPNMKHELNIPQLRVWPLRHFPYMLFYIEHADHLDVIRCVHEHRDIPASFREET